MDYRYLRAFLALGEKHSFTAAASELGIAVSALSRQIRLFEESVSETLFLRSSRSVAFTPAGERLWKAARQLATALNQECTNEIKPIAIGCLQSILESFLCDIIVANPDTFKGLSEIRVSSPETLERMLREGQLDVIFSTMAPTSPQLASFAICRENLYLVSKNEKVLSGTDAPWIIYTPLEKSYPPDTMKAKSAVRVSSFNAALALARSGFGQTIIPMPPSFLQGKSKIADELSIEPFRSSTPETVYIVFPAFDPTPRHIKRVVELVKNNVKFRKR